MTDESQTGSAGYGQQDPSPANDDANMIAFLIDQALGRIATVKPVQVTAVHPGDGTPPAAGTVDVRPLVAQVDGAGNAVQHGTIYGRPYFRLRGGKWSVAIDPDVDDIGLLLVCDRDISAAQTAAQGSGSPFVTPATFARFSLSDGVYLGGIFTKATNRYLWLKADGGAKLNDESGNVIETSADGIALTPATSKPVTVNGNLVVTGNMQLGGTIEAQDGSTYGQAISTTGDVVAGVGGADQVGLKTHTHGGVTTGAGQTAPPTAGT